MTDPLTPRMRWWGWGVDGQAASLPRGATTLLRDELGVAGAGGAPVELADVDLTAPALHDDPKHIARRRTAARAILKRHGAVALGPAPGQSWAKGRFHGAYLRDELLARGVLVDTLETATTWTELTNLHGGVVSAIVHALRERGTPAIVMCHVSHLYPTGASLYFTFLARQQPGHELEQWHAAKRAASDAISHAGATITHHHAVGRDHAPWLAHEIGDLGIAALRAVKERVDPAGIMNPGKLLG